MPLDCPGCPGAGKRVHRALLLGDAARLLPGAPAAEPGLRPVGHCTRWTGGLGGSSRRVVSSTRDLPPGPRSGLPPGSLSLFPFAQKNPWPRGSSPTRCAGRRGPKVLSQRESSQGGPQERWCHAVPQMASAPRGGLTRGVDGDALPPTDGLGGNSVPGGPWAEDSCGLPRGRGGHRAWTAGTHEAPSLHQHPPQTWKRRGAQPKPATKSLPQGSVQGTAWTLPVGI